MDPSLKATCTVSPGKGAPLGGNNMLPALLLKKTSREAELNLKCCYLNKSTHSPPLNSQGPGSQLLEAMAGSQCQKNPQTQVMLLRCQLPSGARLQHLPPALLYLLWPQAPLLPDRKGQHPPAEGRAGAPTPPGDPSPRSPCCPGPTRAQPAAGWLTPAGPRADKRPIFSPPK